MKASLRPVRDGDLEVLCANPRPACVAEMRRLGTTFEDALVDSVRRSDWVAAGCIDDVPVCLFGVAPVSMLGGLGAPWLLASCGFDRRDVEFLREMLPACHRVMDAMLATYPRLLNVVDARNARTIRWLGWMGFTFAPAPVVVRGHPFRVFHADKE